MRRNTDRSAVLGSIIVVHCRKVLVLAPAARSKR